MAQPARAAAAAKIAPKKERFGVMALQPKRAAPAVPRVAPRAAPCACGGQCPKCQRRVRVSDAPPAALREDAAAEQEAEELSRLLARAFAGAAPIPPADTNRAAADKLAPLRQGPPPRPRIQPTSRPDSSLGSGFPLPDSIRRRLEPALGFDLSALRVHTDASAGRLAERHRARAFAFGSHLIFARGEYAPEQSRGQGVLAHEVVHAVQQSSRARDPWSSGSLSTHARPRGPPGRDAQLVSVQHGFASPRVQRLPGWDDVSNTFVAVGSAAVDTVVDVGSSALGVAVDLGEGALEVGAVVIERTADFFTGLVDDYAPGLLEFLRGGFMSRLTDLFCRGLDAVIGGLISSLADIDFVSALEEAFSSAQGSVEGVIGAIRSGAGSALGSLMQPVVAALDEYGPGIIDAITGASDSVNGFFDSIWEAIGAPAMDFLGAAGGAIWEEITGMIDWLWEATSGVRDAAADAWGWVMEQFGVAWESTSGIRDWLAEKATEAWDAMKEALGPLEGPITVLLGILVILSPLGPIIIATQVIPPLWEKLVWLWNNWNTDDILVWAQDTLREDILPGIIGMVSGVASAIAHAASWIAGVTVQAATAFGGIIGAFGGNACLATVTRVLHAVSAQFERLAAWATGDFTGLAKAISNVFHRVVAILQPILDFLVRLVLVVTNPPLLPIAIVGAVWLLIPADLKPPVINFVLDLVIAFLSGFPAFLTGLGPAASILKAGFLGFLEGLRGAEDEQKIAASNKVANFMAGAGIAFIAGFGIGVLQGLIDGILEPFRLIWMIIQFLARLCRSIGDYLAPLLFQALPQLGASVTGANASMRSLIPDHPPAHAPPEAVGGHEATADTLSASEPATSGAGDAVTASSTATLARGTPGSVAGPTAVAPPVDVTSATVAGPTAGPEHAVFSEILGAGPTVSDAAIVASLSPGLSGELTGAAGELDAAGAEGESTAASEISGEGRSVSGLADLLGGIWTAILDGAHSLGESAAGALLHFITLSDYELGNKVGYVAGLILLEVIVAYFSGGVSLELKAAEPFIRAAIRFLDLGGEILGLLGRAIRPIRGPLLRGFSAVGDQLGRFRFLQPIIQRIRRAADTLFHFGDEAAEVAGRAGRRGDGGARHADDVADLAARRADDVADGVGTGGRLDDAAGAGGRADDVADAGHHADDAGRHADDTAEAGGHATERTAAIAAARLITDANDARDTPTPLLIPQLLTLRSRFRWINGFEATWTGTPGRYRVVMRSTPETIKEPYTTDAATPAELAEHADDLPPGSLGDGIELDVPLTHPPDPWLGTFVGPNPNPAPAMRGDTRGRAYTSTRRTTRPLPATAMPEVVHVRRPTRSRREFIPSSADDAAMADTRAARDLAVDTHRDLPLADQGRTVAVGTGRDTPVRTSGGYTVDDPGGPGRVEARATETGHDLAPHPHDPTDARGRYHASHAEKQVITDSPNSGAGVSRDQCEDCIAFFRREAVAQGRNIPVTDPSCSRLFHPDGSVTELWNHGPVVRYRPDGTVSVVPGRPLQPKLIVTKPGDRYEAEADRMADAVLSSDPSPAFPCISAYQPSTVMLAGVRRSVAAEANAPFERALDTSDAGGRALPDGIRHRMEARFGIEFSAVRVHHDGTSATLSQQVRAHAFTTGRDIYFASGQYRPGTSTGDRLLAHELTHVVQQSSGAAGALVPRRSTRPSPAQRAGRAVQRTPADNQIQSYVFAGDRRLATDAVYARQRGGEMGDQIRRKDGQLSHPERLEVKGMLEFFRGKAKEAYTAEIRTAVNDVAGEIEMPGETVAPQTYVFGGDPSLASETWFAQKRGREIAARIRNSGGRPSRDDELEKQGMTKFFQGRARELYVHQIQSYSRPVEPRLAQLVRDTVAEVDRDSPRDKVLTALGLAGVNLNAKQWALELAALRHHKSGNYLLRYFEMAYDRGFWDYIFQTGLAKGHVANLLMEVLEETGVHVREMSVEWQVHLALIAERSKPVVVDLRKYPIYTWKTALGSLLQPFIPIINLVLHFIPLFGQALGALEAIIGREILTGRKLEGWERLLEIIPYAGTIIRGGDRGAKAVLAIARSTGIKPDAVLSLVAKTNRAASELPHLQQVQKQLSTGATRTAQQEGAVKRTYWLLKPVEKEMDVAAAAGQLDARSAKAGNAAANVDPAAASVAKKAAEADMPGTGGARTIEEQTIKSQNLAQRSEEYGGHHWQVLKDGRVYRCSKFCSLSTLAEAFPDVINRYPHLGDALRQAEKVEGVTKAEAITGLSVRLQNVRRAQRLSVAKIEKLLDTPEYAVGTALGSDLRYVRYRKERGKLPFAEWESKAQNAWKNQAGGSRREKELAEAFGLGGKNNVHLVSPDPKKSPSFIPDHVEGNPAVLQWGRPYRFKEIKDWADMSDTGNLSAMLDYVRSVPGSHLKIYFKSNTYMSHPLRAKIDTLVQQGRVELVPFVGP